MQAPSAFFCHQGHIRCYNNPETILTAARLEEVLPVLAQVEAAVDSGLHAAGYLAYEAAPAFDPAMKPHAPDALPLLCFALYKDYTQTPPPMLEGAYTLGPWQAALDEAAYLEAIMAIREHIAAGDTYQINFTFPLEAAFEGDAFAWFRRLAAMQGQGYFGYFDAGRHALLSASPELFFQLNGERLITRPMKGTRPRGASLEEDERLRAALAASEKDRAENIMIVDLLRNDLGRISASGTIKVSDCFQIEAYPTVWQMTSTVSGRSEASLPEIFQALFPCGSVTGAPKIASMKIIHDLEAQPRGLYCGALGWWSPGRQAAFNVAIRTAVIDREKGRAHYAVGSGVTWYSSAEGEYQECLDKAAILGEAAAPFSLIESLRLDRAGYWLEAEHLDRLLRSAAYWGIPIERATVRQALAQHATSVKALPAKVRLLVDFDGQIRLESSRMPEPKVLRVGLAQQVTPRDHLFLRHKTTARQVYEAARASRPDCDEVLLWNEAGEITEGSIANLVLEKDGMQYTPPLSSGLLPGCFRAALLAEGSLQEKRLYKQDLAKADRIRLINAVRGWIEITYVDA